MTSLARRLGLVAALCGLLSGCAQTGPPLPPSLELPKPPSDLRASRKGSQVTLTWSVPVRTTDRQTARSLGPTLICRSLEDAANACRIPIAQLPAATRAAQTAGIGEPQSQVFT